jgi:radical SAM superfamily enzyme YgiQ (UPF0313 family)
VTHSSRILLLNANATMSPYRVAPLGLAFVASALEAAGHHVRFLDLPQSSRDRRRFLRVLSDWPADFLALGIRNLDNSDFHGFQSYLAEPAALVSEARRLRPDLKVIVGGSAATVSPQLVLDRVKPDHVVLGEGEESLPAVIADLLAGRPLPPVVTQGGQPFRVQRTEALPAPRLHQWVQDLRPYLRGDAGYPVQTKRGCPLKCSYCTYGRIEGTRYRFLEPSAVADEIEGARARGVRDFEFVDSTFNLPARHAIEVLRHLQDRRLTANYVGTGLNPSRLPSELLAPMREIGFRSVILTAESASDTMLASYQKSYRRDALHAAADQLAAHGMIALWVFLLGGPGETDQTVAETLSFIEERIHPPHAVYITSGIRIYDGSPIADDAAAGVFAKEDLRRRAELPDLEFFYSHATPPDWLENRLRTFQAAHPHVMLSCEGHARLTRLALRVMNHLPIPKPYWQYIPTLNRLRRRLPGTR